MGETPEARVRFVYHDGPLGVDIEAFRDGTNGGLERSQAAAALAHVLHHHAQTLNRRQPFDDLSVGFVRRVQAEESAPIGLDSLWRPHHPYASFVTTLHDFRPLRPAADPESYSCRVRRGSDSSGIEALAVYLHDPPRLFQFYRLGLKRDLDALVTRLETPGVDWRSFE